MNKCILGIDTSNYRTSVALVSLKGEIIASRRKLLEVKKGERGLRQSDALFQHIKELPNLISEIINSDVEIVAVAYSDKPRPVEGSYMPVFLAGKSIGQSIAASLNVPYYEFSHQEGHISAAKSISNEVLEPYISFHFSGGTTEILLCNDSSITKVGGTLDISFGQLLDRIGVKLGYQFPCGEELDKIASKSTKSFENTISKVKINDNYFNLSGLETQLLKLIDKDTDKEEVIIITFNEIIRIINQIIESLKIQYDVNCFLFAGGVSSSNYIKSNIQTNSKVFFAPEELAGDNAIGIGLLGGLKYGQETGNYITTK